MSGGSQPRVKCCVGLREGQFEPTHKEQPSMTLRATKEKSGHCPRCREDVRTVRPWPHWRKVRYGYFAMLGVALFCTPVILCDGFVLIPCLMLFMAAIGPLNSFVAKPATCAQCGAPVDALRHLHVLPGGRQPSGLGTAGG